MIVTALAPGLSLWTADFEVCEIDGRQEARGKLLRGRSVTKSFAVRIDRSGAFGVTTSALPNRTIRFALPESETRRRARR